MPKSEPKKIMVGLGNPGIEYEHTYHNAGFLMLESALTHLGPSPEWKKYKRSFEYAEADGFVFVRPLTFMNASGNAVLEALKKFGLQPKDLIVVHDDSDITVGNYKISFARSSAGHKGVQSIIDTLKTNEFTRIRIGIRQPNEARRKKAGEFALKKISKKDQGTISALAPLLYKNVTVKA